MHAAPPISSTPHAGAASSRARAVSRHAGVARARCAPRAICRSPSSRRAPRFMLLRRALRAGAGSADPGRAARGRREPPRGHPLPALAAELLAPEERGDPRGSARQPLARGRFAYLRTRGRLLRPASAGATRRLAAVGLQSAVPRRRARAGADRPRQRGAAASARRLDGRVRRALGSRSPGTPIRSRCAWPTSASPPAICGGFDGLGPGASRPRGNARGLSAAPPRARPARQPSAGERLRPAGRGGVFCTGRSRQRCGAAARSSSPPRSPSRCAPTAATSSSRRCTSSIVMQRCLQALALLDPRRPAGAQDPGAGA